MIVKTSSTNQPEIGPSPTDANFNKSAPERPPACRQRQSHPGAIQSGHTSQCKQQNDGESEHENSEAGGKQDHLQARTPVPIVLNELALPLLLPALPAAGFFSDDQALAHTIGIM